MGDVARILYVHVPCAWNSLLAYTIAFGFAIASLWTRRARWDHLMVGAVEIGLVLNGLLLVQGMLFARPTWGIWWTWGDVRLVFSFLLFLLFAGVLALRAMVDDPARRGSWTAIATIVAFVDVPLVYFCVRWWRTLHQMQSTPGDDVGRAQAADADQRLRHPLPGLLVHRAAGRAGAAAPGSRRSTRAGTNPGGRPARRDLMRSSPSRQIEPTYRDEMQPEGVIIGGWNFVVAAYAVTAVVLAAYAWSVRSRLAKLESRTRPPLRKEGEPTDG